MYNTTKFSHVRFWIISFCIFSINGFISSATADENYIGNVQVDSNIIMNMESRENINLPFNPNNYTFLVYNPGGSQSSIKPAMEKILGRPLYSSEIRTSTNPVTAADLANADILIVGWNADGNISGLHSDDLAAGITGRVILTGHDLDLHTVYGPNMVPPQTMFTQAINYVLAGKGTGLIRLGGSDNFPYIPNSWGISWIEKTGNTITQFTAEALASGVYNGLTPANMSGWGTSYHNGFSIGANSLFVPFELDNNVNATIARTNGILNLTETANTFGPCVCPGENITYNITCGNPHDVTIYNVQIINHLPAEINFVSASDNGIYDSQTHSVYWNLASFASGSQHMCELIVQPNRRALPLTQIGNTVEIMANGYYNHFTGTAVEVCDWSGGIIYVKKDATGLKNGTSWNDAFKELRDAYPEIQRQDGNATAVWVAAGTYKPVVDTNVPGYQLKSFALLNNIALIGHFAGNEESPDDRVLSNPANDTILDGKIGTTASQAVYNIVKAANVSNALIDGFTIKGAYTYGSSNYGAGIYLDNSNVSIANCRIEKNNPYGIYAINYSFPDIHNCIFFSNTSAGCYTVTSCQPVVSYSVFDGNNIASTNGLKIETRCAATVLNSLFKNNKTSGIYGLSNGSLDASDCNFTNNYNGVNISDITTKLIDCNIANSSNNGINCASSGITLDHTSVKNSTGNGLNCTSSTVTLRHTTIRNNTVSGLYSSGLNSKVDIDYSSISKNTVHGIHGDNSDVNVSHCLLENNVNNGIYTYNGCKLQMQNSVVRCSGGHGLELRQNITSSIKNTWINNNGKSHSTTDGGAGIYFEDTSQTPLVRNNTIYGNWTYGIYANLHGPDPNVRNCIIYSNGTRDVNDLVREAGGSPFTKVNYNYLQTAHSGTDNFVANPLFTFSPDANDLHLRYDSPCIGKGDPCGIYTDEKDIDDERRNNGRLDDGADENFWSHADYNLDGTVNFIDYAKLAVKWLKIDAQISLDGDTDVDLADLKLFCNDWLWLNDMQSMSLGYSMPQGDSMTMMAQLGGQSLKTVDKKVANNSLLITDVKKSKALRPQRIAQKTDFFYSITKQSVEARKAAANPKPIDVNELAAWAQKMWDEDPQLRATTTEKEWFALIEEIKKSQ